VRLETSVIYLGVATTGMLSYKEVSSRADNVLCDEGCAALDDCNV
jgi:hypothetical protein